MVVLRCKCMNVNLHLSRAPVPISPDSEVHVWISEQTNIKKVGEAELGMGGSKSEYEKLISHRKIHGWKLTRCCNCNIDLYLISLTNPTLALVNMELDDLSTPIQSNINTNTNSPNTNSPNSSPASSVRKFSTPASANTTNTNSNANTPTPTPPSQLFHYSPTFRMFLLKSGNEDNELLIPPSDSDPTSIPTFNKLQKQIDDFLAEEERLMDRRIKAFIKEQNEHFKEVQAAAYTDRKLLWNKICTINSGTGNTTQTSTTTSTPTSTTTALTPTSTPKAKDWTSARVKLQGSSESLSASSSSISLNRFSADYQNNTPNDSNNNNNNNNNDTNDTNNNNNTTNTTSTQNVDSTTPSTDPTPITEPKTTPIPTTTSFIPKQNGSAKMPNGHTSDEPDAMFSFDEEDESKNESDDHTTAHNVEEEKEEVELPPLSKHRLVGATQQGSSSSYSGLSSPQLLGTSVPVAIPAIGKISSVQQRFSRESRRGSRTSQNEDAFDMDFQAALQKGVARTYVVPRQSWATTILEPSDIQPEMAQSFRVPLSLNYRRTNRTGE